VKLERPQREDRAAEAGQSRRGPRRRVLVTVLLALALLLAAGLLIGKAASYAELTASLRGANGWWFGACVAGEIMAYAGYIAAYRDVARVEDGPELSVRVAAEVVALGFGAFVVASAGGPAVDYWALNRAGASPADAFRRVLALNTYKFFVLGVAAMLSAAAVVAGAGHGAPLAMTLPWLVVVPACIAAGIWLSDPAHGGRLAERPHAVAPPRALRGFEHWLLYLLRQGLAEAIGGVRYVRRLIVQPRRYPAALPGYIVYWAGDLLCIYAGVRAFGGHIGVAQVTLAYSTGYIATSLPLPAGGTGGVEAAMTFALSAVGVPLAPALLGVVAYRVFNFWLPIVPALAMLPALRRLESELHAAAQTADATG
jgi:uncharacterized membrane protein YbhN (UPF0104 family)